MDMAGWQRRERGRAAGPIPVGHPGSAPAASLWVTSGICFLLAVQLVLVFLQTVNWDEFRFLADVHQYRQGTLSVWLQTSHVHLFAWLPLLTANEIDQVIAARLAMLVIEAGTVALIVRAGRSFMPIEAALFGALAYLACSYVIRHGASFRFDPLAAFLVMGALVLLLEAQASRVRMAFAGLLCAAATLVTVKAVFYAPPIAAAAWWRLRHQPKILLWFPIAAAGSFVLLALFHWLSLGTPDVAASGQIATSGFRKTVAEAGFLPRGRELLRTLITDPIVWLTILCGLWFAVRDWVRATADEKTKLAVLVTVGSLLLSLIFYRNAFPYYYAFLLPPVTILAGYGLARLQRPNLYPVLTLALIGMALVHAAQALSPALAVQRAHLALIHRLFPEPVVYIDRASMVASFPKVGFFMSSWGLENYRDAGRPILRDAIVADRPAFVLANGPALEGALEGRDAIGPSLLPEDVRALRENYVHHWGRLWVAGKRLRASPAISTFDLIIPGLYTVEAAGPVVLDGRQRLTGDRVRLDRGPHRLLAPTDTVVTLRYGDPLAVPPPPPPAGPIFGGL